MLRSCPFGTLIENVADYDQKKNVWQLYIIVIEYVF